MFAALSRFAQALQENAFPEESKFQVLVVLFESINFSSSAGSWNWVRNQQRVIDTFPSHTYGKEIQNTDCFLLFQTELHLSRWGVIKSACSMRAANADPFRMGFVWVCWACWVILCHHLSGMEPPAAVSYTGTHGYRVLALNNLNVTSSCPWGCLLWAWWCAGTKFKVALDSKYLFVLLGRAFLSRGHGRK